MSEPTPKSSAKLPFPGGRLDGLDALRSFAMLAGILLHASIAYLPNRVPNMVWPVFDHQTSTICDIVYWGLHAFRLPTFFFISGFFTEYLYQTHGPQKFLRHRVRRLMIPYAVSAGTILPLTLCSWVMGWLISDRCSLEQAITLNVPFSDDLQNNFFGPGHLWFLYDLSVISVSYLLLRQEFATDDRDSNAVLNWLIGPVKAPALLAIPAAMILRTNPRIMIDFHNTFLPDVSRILYFSIYFTVGVVAFRRREQFFKSFRLPEVHLAISMTFVTAMFFFVRPILSGDTSLLVSLGFSGCVGLSAWFFIFGAMGLVVRCGEFHSPCIRYLADSSYWMYLIHFPIIGLTHIAFYGAPIPPVIKMFLTFCIATSVGLGSYAVFVRHTAIGNFLHGPRRCSNPRRPDLRHSETDNRAQDGTAKYRRAA